MWHRIGNRVAPGMVVKPSGIGECLVAVIVVPRTNGRRRCDWRYGPEGSRFRQQIEEIAVHMQRQRPDHSP